eukprot:6845048-Karenia_brevis.AAC.1
MKLGWKKVRGWECMYKHPVKKIYLSVYVDDFRLAGDKRNISAMRVELKKHLDLDEAPPLDGSVYLGVQQRDIPPPK